MTFKDVYTLPFKFQHDNADLGRVIDANGQFCFEFNYDNEDIDGEFKEYILDVINNGGNELSPCDVSKSYYIGTEVFLGENSTTNWVIESLGKERDPGHLIRIRGWGYLTGSGGLNLPVKEAVKVQDSLAQYIVDRLNNEV